MKATTAIASKSVMKVEEVKLVINIRPLAILEQQAQMKSTTAIAGELVMKDEGNKVVREHEPLAMAR